MLRADVDAGIRGVDRHRTPALPGVIDRAAGHFPGTAANDDDQVGVRAIEDGLIPSPVQQRCFDIPLRHFVRPRIIQRYACIPIDDDGDRVRLQNVESATSVRGEPGKTLLSDGPFVDSKEYLGGLIIVDADNLDGALAVASELRGHMRPGGGGIEVRPILEQELGGA